LTFQYIATRSLNYTANRFSADDNETGNQFASIVVAMQSSQIRKAAVLLMSLPSDQAASLIGKLDDKQVELVSIEIARLGRLRSEEQESVIMEFAEANPKSLGGDKGGLDVAKGLLEKALGANAAGAIENIRHNVEAMPFSFLKDADPQDIRTFISDEHPQTIALILSFLSPAVGAEILAALPPDRQLPVIRRIANMGQTNPEVITEVENGLERRMSAVMSEKFAKAGGVPNVAEILNVCERAVERTLLENLSQEDPDLVEEIRRLMFVFEDITKISDKDIQTVLKNVESSQWAMALKGASEALKEKILGNMSSRASEMLSEEMEFLGSVRLSEVEGMQQQIVDVVRRLEDLGELSVHADNESEEFIT